MKVTSYCWVTAFFLAYLCLIAVVALSNPTTASWMVIYPVGIAGFVAFLGTTVMFAMRN